ncbi:DinB family protein [Streptomyces sp. SDT5-1]|uniref:DinB family protein n=1 Tax=Streptomyces sp. SDT5-1 TaxID=3406418 RepID=UPI003FD658E6
MHDLHTLLREYDRARAYTDGLSRDLTPDEVIWRPNEDSSAIGWHLGHALPPAPASDLLGRVDGYLVCTPCA